MVILFFKGTLKQNGPFFDMNLQILLFDKCPLFQHLKHFISLFLSFEVSFLSINSSNVNDFFLQKDIARTKTLTSNEFT